ncbi:MAG TPA: hopanoid-associated sugar epimerase [Gammaproteobacteria bacterium]|nr:hopanoid-associated sugar epimerase [Gammaproteobacteria bacterium]
MTETVLVTGATGFVGSAVARRLLAAGLKVRALVRSTSRLDNLRGLDVDIVRGDLRAPASLAAALAGCEGLFHVAADYRLWARHPSEIYASNVRGTRNILLAAARAGVGRIVYTSSVATLGLRADGTPADEDTPTTAASMIGHYKRSKFLAEQHVRQLAAKQGIAVVTVNPSAPVGPRDIKPTPTGRMILDAARGRMPAYVDTGLNIVHVDDVAEGHVLAYRRGAAGRRYILGGEDMSLREILTTVAGLTGRHPPFLRLPHNLVLPVAWIAEAWARLGGPEPTVTVDGVKLAKKRMYFSHARADNELGYRPRPAVEAIADAVRWFEENGYLEIGVRRSGLPHEHC